MRWPDLYDVIALVGLGMLAYGLWLVYAPLAFIVPGALLILLSLATARKRGQG